MHKDEEKFLEVLKSFVEIFKLGGPFIREKQEASIEDNIDLSKRISSMMDDLSPENKAAMLHGIMVYLFLLVNNYDAHYDDEAMPTACIVAESCLSGIDDTLKKELFINSSMAVIHALEYPLTFRKSTQPEESKMFEILMTADCANSSKGD